MADNSKPATNYIAACVLAIGSVVGFYLAIGYEFNYFTFLIVFIFQVIGGMSAQIAVLTTTCCLLREFRVAARLLLVVIIITYTKMG